MTFFTQSTQTPKQRYLSAALILLALFACIFFLLFFYELPGTTHAWRATQDSGHALIFFGCSVLLLFLWHYIALAAVSRVRIVAVYCSCLLLGGSIEIIQSQVGRSGSWSDFALDCIGAAAGCAVYLAITKTDKRWWGLFPVAALLLLVGFSRPLSWKYEELQRDQRLPILANFDNDWPSPFIEPVLGAKFTVVPAPEAWVNNTSHVAKVIFSVEPWPGLAIKETPADWSDYSHLGFDVYNGSGIAQKLVVRVHDKAHNNAWADRFNRTYTIPPGISHVGIPLSLIKNAPKNREMDLTKIQTLMLFAYKPLVSFELFFDNIQLKK